MDHMDGSRMSKAKNSENIPLGEQQQLDSVDSDQEPVQPQNNIARNQPQNNNVRNHQSQFDSSYSNQQPVLPQNNNAGIQPSNNNIREARMPVKKHAIKYNMSHPYRGLLLIFNNENFDESTGQGRRLASREDVNKIERCFTAIGYNIEVYTDFTAEQISTRIRQCRNADYNNCDSLAVFILTHGEPGQLLWAKDELYNPAEVVWGNLTSDKCPSLAGKPKLIFVQACKGIKLDSGIKLVDHQTPRLSQFDGALSSYMLPVCADFLIGYPTFDAFRNDTDGSKWITILCEVLERNYHNLDINSILTLVNQRVALDFQSDNYLDENRDGKRQAPYFSSSLTRHLVFGERRR